MSDRMRPIPFYTLMHAILTEHQLHSTVMQVPVAPRFQAGPRFHLFGERMEVPFGPAAGPHTQLCQNIIAAYVGGARFFELKTVQTLDGEDLPVSKPCILAENEGYNVEWSTELTVPQALDEYVKAWYALKLLSRELALGAEDGFVFNMSVGYDLKGISSPKIDAFIEGLKDASALPIWAACRRDAQALLPLLRRVDGAYLDQISPRVCRSITLSTLHGCPAGEIESIAAYLLREKGLHTFVKCNPTLLGYERTRDVLNQMGYAYLSFDRHHFDADLQLEQAVPMLTRLMALAQAHGLTFGVKLTNTFPVEIRGGELPGEEMYLSGKALYPLALSVTQALAQAFDGQLPISYSGGADAFNIQALYGCGIWPITVATTLLKPGGYRRLAQLSAAFHGDKEICFTGVSLSKLAELRQTVATDPHYTTPEKAVPRPKWTQAVPLLDCFAAPCQGVCPIGQDIPAYLRQMELGNPDEALRIILERNPLPHMTGTICPHPCTTGCVRRDYDEPLQVRQAKLAATAAWGTVLPTQRPGPARPTLRVAIVGGGPGGMAAAAFLARGGADVTLFEARGALGGVVRHIIPAFRISDAAIDADAALLTQLGVTVRLNQAAPGARALLEQGFTHVILATGAWVPGHLSIEGAAPTNVLHFLARCKQGAQAGARHIVVVGGGNSAMDAARAAKRLPEAESVTIVYRRTRQYMPADAEELEAAAAEGVAFRPLLAPTAWDGETLTCQVMRLGPPDSSGRRSPVPTGETVTLPAGLLVAAVGEGIDQTLLLENGVTLNSNGRPAVSPATMEAAASHIFVVGDARRGPATVVEAIADAAKAAQAILGPASMPPAPRWGDVQAADSRRGILQDAKSGADECARCLSCSTLCENCVDVCPNRANVSIALSTHRMPQVVHVDGMCNECGNCATFCPYDSAPYRDKFTVFGSEADFLASENSGFVLLDGQTQRVRVRLDGATVEAQLSNPSTPLPSSIHELIETILSEYPMLLY